jgi:hypothetical protein
MRGQELSTIPAVLALAVLLLAGCSGPRAALPETPGADASTAVDDHPTAAPSGTPPGLAGAPTSSLAAIPVLAGPPRNLTILVDDSRNPIFTFTVDDAMGLTWTFGDGTSSSETAPLHTYIESGPFMVTATAADNTTGSVLVHSRGGFVPHVIVAVSDSGINPYHATYRRPHLVNHPCTYIESFPCSLPALNLSLNEPSYEAAVAKDAQVWASVDAGEAYWIPGTAIVAAVCRAPYTGGATNPEATVAGGVPVCILGENHHHGTHTSSTILRQNPEALLAFQESGSNLDGFHEHVIPFDVSTLSYGTIVPLPANTLPQEISPLHFQSAGNDGRSSYLDAEKGNPRTINVGGVASRTEEEADSGRQVEVVGPFCREDLADHLSLDALTSNCGTSFASPTAAGSLSLTILRVRQASGYTGNTVDGIVDASLGIRAADVRAAMNRTATYAPTDDIAPGLVGIPLNPVAPWVQWGWGYFGANEAELAALHLLGTTQPDKPAEAYQYMEAQMAVKAAKSVPSSTACGIIEPDGNC